MNSYIAAIIDNPNLPQTDPSSALTNGLNLAFGVLGGIALLMITLQGFRYATSDGDPGKTKQAKDGIIYSLIGIVVALMGGSITNFVLGVALENSGSSDLLVGSDSIFVTAATLIAFITGIASVIMIVIAGIKYNLSNGDPAKTASAKNSIIYALIGVSISAIAAPLIIFIVNQVTS